MTLEGRERFTRAAGMTLEEAVKLNGAMRALSARLSEGVMESVRWQTEAYREFTRAAARISEAVWSLETLETTLHRPKWHPGHGWICEVCEAETMALECLLEVPCRVDGD